MITIIVIRNRWSENF